MKWPLPVRADAPAPEPPLAPGAKPREGPRALRALLAVPSNVLDSLPDPALLPEGAWRLRHRLVVGILAAHAPLLLAYGLTAGTSAPAAVAAAAVPAVLAVLAAHPARPRRRATMLAVLGLFAASAGLVLLSHGLPVAHFHFFVVLALVGLYQDPSALFVGVLMALGQHAAAAVVVPAMFYGARGSVDPAFETALHGTALLGLVGLQLVGWGLQKDAHARSDLVLRSTADGVLGLDLDGNIVSANPAAEALTGYATPDLAGRSADALLAAHAGLELHRPAGCPIHGTLRLGRRHHVGNAELRRRGGARLPVEMECTPIVEQGRIVGAVLTIKDISDRERAEAARQLARDRLVEIERLRQMDQFRRLLLNTASHELNTPLTPLMIHTSLLKDEALGPLNDRQRRSVDLLDRNVGRLADLVRDVLDVARIDSGRMRLEVQEVELAGLLREAVETFRETARQGGVTLELRVEAAMTVQGDAKRVMQVVFNLLSNAVKFTPAGGRIRVTSARQASAVRVAVSDTGIGLAAEEIPRLFQPFSQVGPVRSARPEGTGLGLYICKGIVESHGGRIWAESQGRGRGTTITFELPLAAPTVLVSPAPPAGRTGGNGGTAERAAPPKKLSAPR